MKNLLSAVWRNSLRPKIGQFEYIRHVSVGFVGEVLTFFSGGLRRRAAVGAVVSE